MSERFLGNLSSASFTPAAAAYSANDVISVAQQFALLGPLIGGPVMITSASLLVAHTAVISGETSYNLHLYNVTPPSAHADNDAWDLPAGDRTAFLGTISLGTPVDIGSSLWVETNGINKQIYVLGGANAGTVWGELVTVGAFTATAAARTVRLHSIWL
jgi:hypothetical protein